MIISVTLQISIHTKEFPDDVNERKRANSIGFTLTIAPDPDRERSKSIGAKNHTRSPSISFVLSLLFV